MVALALPLAPLAPGAAAAAGTFVIGSAAYIAQQVHGFRAPLPAPMIPRTGGKAGGATMQEMVADAIAGARIPVAFPPNPLGPKGSIGLAGLMAAAGFLGPRLAQLWGWFASRPPRTVGKPYPSGLKITGKVPGPNNTTAATFEWFVGIGESAPGIPPACTTSGGTINSVRTRVATIGNIVAVEPYVVTATCGPRVIGFRVKNGSGTWTNSVLTEASGNGWAKYTSPVEAAWAGPNPVDLVDPGTAAPLPAGYVPPVPGVEPLPASPTVPKLPPGKTEPAPQPEPERSPTPTTPGPSRVPWFPVRVPSTAPKAPPVPARVIVVRPDGKLPAPAKDPVAVTHPDAHYPIPGGGPITGNGPQAKPEEIAKELGRLEQKLNGILNPTPDTPIEWQRLLQQVLEAIMNLTDGTTYTITEKCPPCDPNQDYDPPTVEAVAPGALNAFGVITNRLDAIAKLLDGQLSLKQQICPPCKPTIRGELVTINFQSHPDDVPSRYAVKKHLSYRDLSGRGEDFHAQHWAGYSWQTGAAIVTSKGLPWGIVKVWASDNAEGQRVIAHAATAAGVNLNDPKHEWVFSTTDHPRYGRQAEVWPVTYDPTGKLMISKRNGPSGPSAWKRDS